MGQPRSIIVGTGFMGRVHGHSIRAAGGRIAGIVGRTPERGTELADLFDAPAYPSLADAISAGADVVHVCTPNHTHAGYAQEALDAGLAVVCEKPLATSVADAVDLTRRASGTVTGVPFVYRYHPVVERIRHEIRADPHNRIWLMHGHYVQDWLADRTQTNWRVSKELGGASRAFADIGVHWCDLAEYVTGQRITRVVARTGNAFEREGGVDANLTEDGAVVSFETDDGAIGSLTVSQASAGRRNRLWFSFDGPRATYEFDQENPESAWVGVPGGAGILHRGVGDVLPPNADRPFAVPGGHPYGYQDCFRDFVADCYAALDRDEAGSDRPQFVDGLRATLITAAVLDSVRVGGWVSVPTVAETLDIDAGAAAAPAHR